MSVVSEMFVWVSLDNPNSPPERVRVESCHDCGALVPTAVFDRHGEAHAALERLAAR